MGKSHVLSERHQVDMLERLSLRATRQDVEQRGRQTARQTDRETGRQTDRHSTLIQQQQGRYIGPHCYSCMDSTALGTHRPDQRPASLGEAAANRASKHHPAREDEDMKVHALRRSDHSENISHLSPIAYGTPTPPFIPSYAKLWRMAMRRREEATS